MSDLFDNLAALSEPNAAQLDSRKRMAGPGGILVLTQEPDPPLENVPYILALEGAAPILRIQISGVTHDLLGAAGVSDVAGELELIPEGDTVTVEAGRQLLLHGQLTIEGTLIVDGSVSLI